MPSASGSRSRRVAPGPVDRGPAQRRDALRPPSASSRFTAKSTRPSSTSREPWRLGPPDRILDWLVQEAEDMRFGKHLTRRCACSIACSLNVRMTGHFMPLEPRSSAASAEAASARPSSHDPLSSGPTLVS